MQGKYNFGEVAVVKKVMSSTTHFSGFKRITGLFFAMLLALLVCGCGPSLPNPVESKDGQSYIPIADTAFLIPEKTWLKGYARKSTDGMVGSITLHATIPDVQPWSQERHEEMYWKAGPGKKLEIYLQTNDYRIPTGKMLEEPSEQAAQGLRKYRKVHRLYDEESIAKSSKETVEIRRKMKKKSIDGPDAEREIAEITKERIERNRRNAGKPIMLDVYYVLHENGRMKYFIQCDDEGTPGIFKRCLLYFPVSKKIMAEVHFVSDHLKYVVSMADKLSMKLQEFQSAGLAYQVAKATPTTQH